METQTARTSEARAPAVGTAVDPARLALIALCALLGAYAYWDLIAFSTPAADLSRDVESFLFLPADTAPPVVLLISAWLFYRRWARLRALTAERGAGAWLGWAVLSLGGGAFYAWATYTGTPDLLVPSLMLTLAGIVCLLFGPRGVQVSWVPLVFLVFAMPLPAPLLNDVVFRFQLWTADYTGWLLYAMGLPAFVSGEQILRADDKFAIIEGCSGLRSVETLTMVAILLVDLFRRSGWHAAIILVAAPLVAFGLNGFRAVALILNPHSDIVAIHNLQGIAILLGGVVVLYILDGLLERFVSGPPAETPPPRAAWGGARRERLAAAGGGLALLAGAALLQPTFEPPYPPNVHLAVEIPFELEEWSSRSLPVDTMFLGSVTFQQHIHRRYERDGEKIELFVGIGDRNGRERSAISPKTAFPGSGWIVDERGRVSLESEQNEVQAQLLRSNTRRMLVYHWQEGTDGLADESLRSLLALDASPWRRPGEVVVVRIGAQLDGPPPRDREDAEARLRLFLEALRPRLDDLDQRLSERKRFS